MIGDEGIRMPSGDDYRKRHLAVAISHRIATYIRDDLGVPMDRERHRVIDDLAVEIVSAGDLMNLEVSKQLDVMVRNTIQGLERRVDPPMMMINLTDQQQRDNYEDAKRWRNRPRWVRWFERKTP